MNKWVGAALFILAAALFLIANRASYQGYFQGDELDNLSWTPRGHLADFGKALISPAYDVRNFRPVGHLFFRIMGSRFGLDFPKYLIPVHLLHLCNLWLLWMVLRQMGISQFGAGAGTLFYSFHAAVFDVYWKPMYVFDLLCAGFCLLSLLLWMKRRWILSFAVFWLAYKSKELAVMLPAVLALYELWLGKRQWKLLAPFFAVSLSFGLQALLLNPNRDNAYAFNFTPGAIAATARFYARELFHKPLAGFALLAVPVLVRDRRVWLGVAAAVLLLLPMFLLPERLYGAYWYLPLTGVALTTGALAEGRGRALVAVFLAAWIPWNYLLLRHYRRLTLAADKDHRAYVSALQAAAPSLQDIPLYLYDGVPPGLRSWGLEGALGYLVPRMNVKSYPVDDPTVVTLLQSPALAVLTWIPADHHLWIAAHTPATPDLPYVAMNPVTPLWQLMEGWSPLEGNFRWSAPRAVARLYRPPEATQFEMIVNVGLERLQKAGHVDLSVRLSSGSLWAARFEQIGVQAVHWPLPPGKTGTTYVELRSGPPLGPTATDRRTLGIAVVSFGFSPWGLQRGTQPDRRTASAIAPSVARAVPVQEKAAARAGPAAARRERKASSDTRRSMASWMAPALPGSKCSAASPVIDTSGSIWEQPVGIPAAIDSTTGMPKPSKVEGYRQATAREYKS